MNYKIGTASRCTRMLSFFLPGILALINLSRCTPAKNNENDEGTYKITSPVAIDTSYTKEYVAQIQSLQNIEVRAQVKGYLEKINVDEGQYVHQGQVLFNIMPKQYEADLMKAKANARTEELEVQKEKTLFEKNIVSQTELAIAQSKLDEANAELAQAELQVSFTEIKAPFDGTIDRIKNKIGSLIEEGTLLTTLSNNKEMYAYFNVSESEYLDYKTKMKNDEQSTVTLLLANNEEHKYKGTIETIESVFDNNTGNISFRAKFPNPELLLKHGETGKVRMTFPVKNALVIPQKATYELQDKIYVYVVNENNVVKSRAITIKQRLPNLYIIDSGISEKDKILLEGLQTVKDDDKIKTEFLPASKVLQNLDLLKK